MCLLFFIVTLLLRLCIGEVQNRYLPLEKSNFYSLPIDYSKRKPPEPTPIEVNLNFDVAEFVNIDDRRNELDLEGYLTLEWTDKRINYTSNQSREFFEIKEALRTLWIPDLWIKSLRGYSLHKHIKEQATIEIDTNNKIRFWQSVTVTVSCSMEFLWYPFDCQKCELIFQTNGLDVTKQKFTGRIDTSKNVISSQGALNYEGIITKENPNKTAPGERYTYPQVAATFSFKRRVLDHVLQTFFPTVCLVCLSWISFLIPPYIVPGRMVLLVTVLLVIFSTYQNEGDTSPRASGLKAIDIWFIACMIFILAAIFEYACLLYLKKLFIRRKRLEKIEEKAKIRSHSSASISTLEDEINIKAAWQSRRPSTCSTARISSSSKHQGKEKALALLTNVLNKQKDDEEDDSNEYGDVNEKNHEGDHFLDQIDQNALRIFPLLFITFNVAYWSLCIFIIGDMSTSCE